MVQGLLLAIACFVLCHFPAIWANTNAEDVGALASLKNVWQNYPPNWRGIDPCGNRWEGIACKEDRVFSIKLSSIGLVGRLTDDIKGISELQILDLSFNTGLAGSLPRSIGSLSQLTSLILPGCSFSGDIPREIGLLQNLRYLSLNSNHFSGTIPVTIGNMSSLSWLDLANNSLTGEIPVSSKRTPGLDLLINTTHFHISKNQLTGQIPSQLFSSNMTFVQVFLDGNKLTGSIPSTLGSVRSLEVLRLDRNSLTGSVPPNVRNQTNVFKLHLSNNKLRVEDILNMTAMTKLNYLHVSDPACVKGGSTAPYCQPSQQLGLSYFKRAESCVPITCPSDQDQSPNCHCSYPYAGTLYFRSPSFSDVTNSTHYRTLGNALMISFEANNISIDSVSLYNPKMDSDSYLEVSLEVYPIDLRFNRSDISSIGFILSNQTFKPPAAFGPYYFIGLQYNAFSGEVAQSSKLSVNKGAIAGAVSGSVVFLVVLVLTIFAVMRKRKANRSFDQIDAFAKWDESKHGKSAPNVKGPRLFSYAKIKKITNNFSESSEIGSGEYGKVYRGVLSDGRLVDVIRAQKGSMQERQFKTEIELLSRLHHTNIISLVGFCFEKSHQLLVFEHIANGSLRESLSGKSAIRLDWRKRINVALGAARGLAYLHESADPPTVHNDIRSRNILLDDHLNAKICNFGLSEPIGRDGKSNHATHHIKDAVEHLDPEYFTTFHFTDKSDVYSFGVLLLEIIIAKEPIEGRRYIVREARSSMDKTKVLYGLDKLIDPSIGSINSLRGSERYVDLAMSCVEESGANRPTMSAVVRELENIAQLAGINPYSEASTPASYDMSSKDYSRQHPYENEASISYSGAVYSLSEIEPK